MSFEIFNIDLDEEVPMPKAALRIDKMLADPQVPFELKKQVFMQMIASGDEATDPVLKNVLEAFSSHHGHDQYLEKAKELSQHLERLRSGPLRSGVFMGMQEGKHIGRRAKVMLSDGTITACVVAEEGLVEGIREGDAVWIEAQGNALLAYEHETERAGEEARFERRIGERFVEVTMRDQSLHVFGTCAPLIDDLVQGKIAPGRQLLVCPFRRLAFNAVPERNGLAHYRFLAREPIPDVIVERDLGSPPPFIDDLSEHLFLEMTEPDLARRYRLRRCRMQLLAGVSGAGKTFAALAFWRRMYQIMSDVTHTPIAELPPRVLRLRTSEVLSKWLGESDHNLDRFFDEVEELAPQKFRNPRGQEFELPLLIIFEEIEALGRERGTSEDSVHDRIQTTLLQRLDVTSQKLRDQLAVFLFTTNVPSLVDPAFLRRAGGRIDRFDRLNRVAFSQVLDKHLRDRPLCSQNGAPPGSPEERVEIVQDLTSWLFHPEDRDRALVEITVVGSTHTTVRHRKDFLTAGLVDRAVQQAAAEACRAERQGAARPGIGAGFLMSAIQQQVMGVVDQLQPHNVANYVAVPDGARVASVRRIPQPAILPIELERAS